MHEEHGLRWLGMIPVLRDYPNHVMMSVLIGVVLILSMGIARLQLSKKIRSGNGLIPDPKLSYRNFFEIFAESLYKMTEMVIGHHDAPLYFPIIGTLFTFVFVSNLAGLIPGFQPATDNMNTTFALGIFVFLYYNWVGLRANGLSYLKHFMGPVLLLAPLMFVIELVSHLFRPFSLGLRLRGNIMGDHIVMGVFSDLVPYFVPVAFYALGLFVCFVQAFVFSLMTMVYISMSTSHDH